MSGDERAAWITENPLTQGCCGRQHLYDGAGRICIRPDGHRRPAGAAPAVVAAPDLDTLADVVYFATEGKLSNDECARTARNLLADDRIRITLGTETP